MFLNLIRSFCDNASIAFYSKSNKRSSGSKYVEVKYLVAMDKFEEEKPVIKHINMVAMIPDNPAKGLAPKLFNKHCNKYGCAEFFWHVTTMGAMCVPFGWTLLGCC